MPLEIVGRLLSELGHSVTLLTGALQDGGREESEGPGFQVHYLAGVPGGEIGDAYWRGTAARFDALHERDGPFDIVMGRGTTVWGLFRFSRHAAAVPVILHEGTYPRWMFRLESHAGPLAGLLSRCLAPVVALTDRRLARCMQGAARVVGVTPALAESFRRAYWWRPPRTAAIAYGFDTARYTPRLPDPTAPPRLVSLGRMSWNKGVLPMIDVLAGLRNRSAILEAMGPASPEVAQALLDHAARKQVADRYSLPGAVEHEDVPDRLSGAAAFLFPSTHAEGIAKAVLEAMASGVPVVAYRQAVLEGIIEDGVNGYLVPIRSVADMTDRVDRLLADPALVARMGAAARRKIETEYAPDVIRAQWQALLSEVVAEARARHGG